MKAKHGALLVLAALAPYVGTWSHGFVNYDDHLTILELPLIRHLDLASLPGFFRPDVYAGLPEYMPLKNLSYAVDYAIFGLAPAGFRVQQQFWYALSVVLLFVWLRGLFARMARNGTLGLDAHAADTLALVVAVLFAVHPAHVESVTWLSGRKDVLVGAFMPAALACGLRWDGGLRGSDGGRLAATFTLTLLALLSKPMAAVLPLLFLLQDHVCAAPSTPTLALLRRRAWLYAGSFTLALAFAVLYDAVTRLHAAHMDEMEWAYRGPAFARWGQQLGAFAWLALLPVKLVPLYPPDLLDVAPLSWRALGGYALLAATLGAAAWSVRRRSPIFFALGLFVVPLLPILIRPAWGQYVASRYLYHAVAGTIVALVWLGARLVNARPRLRLLGGTAAAALVLTWGLVTVDYNRAWRDGITLWRYALTVYPTFTRFHDLGGGAAVGAGRVDEAIAILARCVEVAPNNSACLGTLGGILLAPEPEAGETLLRRALPGDTRGVAHLRLAQHLARTGRTREAVALYEGWLHGRRAKTDQIVALVDLVLRDGKLDRALGYAREAVRASAANHPASPPPVEAVLRVARARGDVALEQRVRDAARDCARSDCFRQRLGW